MRSAFGMATAIVFGALSTSAMADGYIASTNGQAQIGIVSTGNLDAYTPAGFVGIGYKFSGQGGRTGFQDALTPGCACEGWGVSGNGIGNSVGQSFGNSGISFISEASGTGTYSSITSASGSGLKVTHAYSIGTETATGALFKASVTIANTTGATITDVRYGRAMDWDVPPTEFNEFVTHKGVLTTASLLHATDDGFADANPMTAVFNSGLYAAPNTEGSQGRGDHGSLFVFGFGDLAAGATKTFNIFYGAGLNEGDALKLLGNVGPELYSLGYSTTSDALGNPIAATNLPTYVFAFNGVGGSVVVPPPVPEPSTYALFGIGLAGLVLMRRRQAKSA